MRKTTKNLKTKVQELEEENNMLKLKYEVLLNMVSIEKELNTIKNKLNILVNTNGSREPPTAKRN